MEVNLLHFNEIKDKRGSLIALENNKEIPFEIKRMYYIFGNTENHRRGFHAHKKLKQVLIALNGSCKVLLDDGLDKVEVLLDSSSKGLLIEDLIWHEMFDFSQDCILVTLASDLYDEQDYIRSYNDFLKTVHEMNNEKVSFFKHPNAIVETNKIGEKTTVWAFSHILPGARIGKNCNINDQTFIENDVVIGDNVTVKSGVYIWDGLRIANNVFIGPNVTFTNDLRPRSKQYPDEFIKTYIDDFASIGANSTVVAGVKIGKFAMVGAGSVVTKNIPPYTLWYGNPASFKGYICKCGSKCSIDGFCQKCNDYIKKDDTE